jgi:hypothetical protein
VLRTTSIGHLMLSRQTTLITDAEAEVAFLAVRLVTLAEILGLLPRSTQGGVDNDQVAAALDAFARAGVGRRGAAIGRDVTADRLAEALRAVLAAIEESPMPEHEWEPLTELLGEDLLARLVGVSVSSARRYRNGERVTPDDVAARLHTVALVTADLAGSYNEFGIRRWFQRSRSALGGVSPAEVLAGRWDPEEERVGAVRALAGALLGSPAT